MPQPAAKTSDAATRVQPCEFLQRQSHFAHSVLTHSDLRGLPQLRTLCFRDGTPLDKESLAALTSLPALRRIECKPMLCNKEQIDDLIKTLRALADGRPWTLKLLPDHGREQAVDVDLSMGGDWNSSAWA